MPASAPNLTFDPTLVDYGTINVGSSSAKKSYAIKNSKAGSTVATAKNLSISFKPSVNSDEAESESWVYYSTPKEATYVRSMDEGPECAGDSIPEAASQVVKTKVKVPSGAETSGTVNFQAHHRYQYTG